MEYLDWIVLTLTIGGIVAYGSWQGKQAKQSLKGFLLADRELPWYHILLSVMATQASAITFLSAPGQAYTDGMRFVQFYLGLPIAMIVLSVTFIPHYYQLKVYTAYQFLEKRFDSKTRILTSLFFLIPNFHRKKINNFNEEHAEIVTSHMIQKITTQFVKHLKDEETAVDQSIEVISKIFNLKELSLNGND